MKPPSLTLMVEDWKADTDGLSVEAKGAWVEVLTRAVVAKKHGTVSKTSAGWARAFGTDQEQADRIISELKADGCARITIGPRKVTITSRRMAASRKMREEQTLRKRKERATKGHNNVTSPFELFWAAWPKHFRKTGKAKCWARWQRDGLDGKAEHVIAVLKAMKMSDKWKESGGQYIPGPIVWLNQQRWDCELSDVSRPAARPFRSDAPVRLQKELDRIKVEGDTPSPEFLKLVETAQGKDAKP